MTRTSLLRLPLVFAMLGLGATGAAEAAKVYVPAVPADAGVDHLDLRIENTTRRPLRAILTRIPSGADGRWDGRDLGKIWVAGKEERVQRLRLSRQASGMIEVDVRPGMKVSARAVSPLGSFDVPVLDERSMLQRRDVAILDGIRLAGSRIVTGLGLVTMGNSEARCEIELSDAAGARLVGPVTVRPSAVSHAYYGDIGKVIGKPNLTDGRATVTCNRPFYAYLHVSDRERAKATFVTPNAGRAPEPESPETPHPGPSVVFTRDGVFHVPTKKDTTEAFDIRVGANAGFSKVVLEVDVTHGGWYPSAPEKMHSLFWIHRGKWLDAKWKRNVFGFLNAFGPGGGQVKLMWDVDLKGGKKEKAGSGAAFQRGHTYRVRWEYDPGRKRIEVNVKDKANGRTVASFGGRTTGPVKADGSGHFMVYFGHPNGHEKGYGPEVPTVGWKYANLRVEFVK